jgi:hypothetical protein
MPFATFSRLLLAFELWVPAQFQQGCQMTRDERGLFHFLIGI